MTRTEEQALLIRSALLGLPSWVPDPSSILFPFIDHVALYFQEPVYVSIWEDGRLAFSSFKYPLLPADLVACPGKQAFRIGRDFTMQVDRARNGRLVLDPAATGELAQLLSSVGFRKLASARPLFELLEKSVAEETLGSFFFQAIQKDLAPKAVKTELDPYQSHQGPRPNEILELLGPAREVVEQALKPLRAPTTGRSDLGEEILAYVSVFPHTTRLLLTGWQAEVVRSACDDRRPADGPSPEAWAKECLAIAQASTGRLSRTTVDEAFFSGVIRFAEGRSGRARTAPPSPTASVETPGGIAEACVHEALVGAETGHRMVVPVHVGGIPWLVLSHHAIGRTSRERWLSNYLFYRDVIPRVASQFRSGAKKAYSEALATVLLGALREGGAFQEVIDRVNEKWRRLAQVFPFRGVQLRRGDSTSVDGIVRLFAPGEGTVRLHTLPDEDQVPRRVNYDQLDIASIVDACERAAAEYGRTRERVANRSLASYTHMLGSRLLQLNHLLGKMGEPGRQAKRLTSDLISLDDFANYVVEPNRKGHRAPSFESLSPREFERFVAAEVDQAFAMEALPSRFTRSRAIAGWLSSGGGTTNSRELRYLSDDAVIRFCRPQVRAVVDGLVSNAVKSVDEDRIQVDVSISMNPTTTLVPKSDEQLMRPQGTPVFIVVANTTDTAGEDLDSLAARLTGVEDASVVGVWTIHLGCTACGYREPTWFVTRNDKELLVAAVQIGEVG